MYATTTSSVVSVVYISVHGTPVLAVQSARVALSLALCTSGLVFYILNYTRETHMGVWRSSYGRESRFTISSATEATSGPVLLVQLGKLLGGVLQSNSISRVC